MMEVLLCRLPFQVFPDQLNLSLQPGDLCFFNVDPSGATFVGPSSHLLFALFVELDNFLKDFDAVIRRISQVHFRSQQRYVRVPVLIKTDPA